jgi:hypothetical protein
MIDLDGDGLPDLLDLATNKRCFRQGTQENATWFRFRGWNQPAPGTDLFAEGASWRSEVSPHPSHLVGLTCALG